MLFRQEIEESLTLKFAASAAERKKRGLPIISLGLGEPDFDVPKEIINATIKVLQSQRIGYSDPMGILSLREKISSKLKNENRINSSANNIIVTAGAKQAFQMACMAILEPGDEVIVINPSFVSFIPQLLIAEPSIKLICVDINKDSFQLPIEKIKQSINKKTKLFIINSPNNPTGYVIDQLTVNSLYELAVKNNFFILSDEIYEKLIFSSSKHFSIGSLEPFPERVITINGFSKSHSMTGWRLGYACFPMSLHSRLLKLQQHMNTNTCTFIQLAMDQSFGISDEYLFEYNLRLIKRAELVSETFKDLQQVSLIPPLGGFFAFLNIKNTKMDSNKFCTELIENTGVATTPGIAFGKEWDDHVRISFAISDDNLNKGLALMHEFISKKV